MQDLRMGPNGRTREYSGRLGQDQILRLAAPTGIYKALHIFFGDDLVRRRVTMPDNGPEFGGAHRSAR